MSSTSKRRFTDQMIDRLRPPASGRLELGDVVVPGLVLRASPSGAKSFSVIYKVPGEGGVSPSGRQLAGAQHRVTLGQYPLLGLADARERARVILGEVSRGADPRAERREQNLRRAKNTLAASVGRFIEQDAKRTNKNWHQAQRAFELHVLPTLGDRPISEVRRADVHALLDGIVASGRVGAAREVRKHMSRLFNWAIDRELVADSPVHGMRRPDLDANESAGRALTDDELRWVWRAAEGLGYPFGPWYQIVLLTGRRREEWAGATRSEIDAGERWHDLPAERHKSARGHIIPLSKAAWAVFEALPVWPGNDYHLFSTSGGRGQIKGYAKAKARLDAAALALARADDPEAAIPPFRVHDLRVTTETRLAALGFNQDVRDAVLGHAKPGLQRTYNKHQYLVEARAAMESYGAHVMEIVK